MRILVVEDEPAIRCLLERGLTEEGHTVVAVGDLASARIAVDAEAIDLVIVDRMLPDGDGLDLVRDLQRRGDERPTLCLTARDRVDERVEGLYGGADDYVTKPFVFDELLARIAAVTRRVRSLSTRLEVADLIVDTDAHRVWRGDTEIRLTAQEFRLLRYLAENAGRVMSRTRILEAVWELQRDPGTNVVEVYMSYLRRKIDKGFSPPLLHTVRGVGYVLEVREPT